MSHTTAAARTATVTTAPTAATARTSATVSTPTAAPTPATGRSRHAGTSLMALQVVLALFYGVASAAPKLLGISAAADSFDKIGFGDWFMYLTGALELAGAIALVIPVLYQVAAIAMIGLMICASVTQFTVFHGDNAATPLLLILPLALIAWARRDSTSALLTLLRASRAGS